MDPTAGTDFSAGEASLGYLYQCRCALLLALRKVGTDPAIEISIERLDDVAFEKDGTPHELIQTKHHIRSTGNPTDGSSDLWKTLRIWSEQVGRDALPIPGALLTLITTVAAPEGSAASHLRSRDRDAMRASSLLVAVASSSRSKENAPAYAAFLALPEEKRIALLDALYVFDRSPNIVDLLPELRHEVRLAARREHLDPFIYRLEGWWFSVVVRHLSSSGIGTILVEEIESQIADLREQFKCDNLPIDFLNAEPPEPPDPENDPRVFVAQLRLISLANPRIEFAIRDYYRAFQQRSRWVREDLLLVGELDTYEHRLVEEWERRFHIMKEGIAPAAADEQKITAGRSLYNWVETGAQIEIRRECREPYVMRGSYQILSDRQRVGWHPEFVERLQALLGEAI